MNNTLGVGEVSSREFVFDDFLGVVVCLLVVDDHGVVVIFLVDDHGVVVTLLVVDVHGEVVVLDDVFDVHGEEEVDFHGDDKLDDCQGVSVVLLVDFGCVVVIFDGLTIFDDFPYDVEGAIDDFFLMEVRKE